VKTYQLRLQLFEFLMQGLSLSEAIQRLGISEARLAKWLLKDRFRNRLQRTLQSRAQFAQLKNAFNLNALPPTTPAPSPATDHSTSAPALPNSQFPPSDNDIDQQLLARLIQQQILDDAPTATASQPATSDQ